MLACDGLTSTGATAPSGKYTFKLDAVQGGQAVSSIALHLGMVNSVSQGSQGVKLNLAGNESVNYADIRQIFCLSLMAQVTQSITAIISRSRT